MKVVCLIDSLGSGGAQRQICMLAQLLKQNSVDVTVVTYYDIPFYLHLLQNAKVPYLNIKWQNKFQRAFFVRRAIRKIKPDIVIAFLVTASLLAILAGIPTRKFSLIVSERSTPINNKFKFIDYIRWNFFRFADHVTTNSFAQERMIRKYASFLNNSICTITNCVDLNVFKQANNSFINAHSEIKILIVARYSIEKNALGLVEAISDLIYRKSLRLFKIEWYGNRFYKNNMPSKLSNYYLDLLEIVKKNGLEKIFILNDATTNIVPIYQSCDAFCLPSFYEGCPNVICEAMACGLPILASNVGDIPILVEQNKNGFMFDPNAPRTISDAFSFFLDLMPEKQIAMGQESRKRAEKLLSPDVFISKYLQLIKKVSIG
jgi:glycosyltransferase involved in cell wall biosynthesis